MTSSTDFYQLDSMLTEEERMIRNTAREFVDDQVRPDIGEHFTEGEFPLELVPEMAELGFFGANFDYEGFPNVSERAYGLIMQELERGDSGVRSYVSAHAALSMYAILAYGSEEQKEEYLHDMRDGEVVGCFGLTEPEHGSDPSGMETRAERNGDGWVLNGSKTWITNSPIADVLVVWARTVEDDEIRGFLVPGDADGLTTNKIDGKLSMRASITGEIGLNDVHLDESRILPGVSGLKGPLGCLNQARYGICWGAVGIAIDCYETARDYATDREQFGGPIGRFQLQQDKLADMLSGITKGQLLCFHLARLKEEGNLEPAHISMAKRENCRMARDAARTAREMLGGNGITDDYPPMRHLANVETVYTYEGTDDIHTLVLGQEATGIPAFE
jgi:glutaryl-CoA dehydrogenase